VRLLFTGLIAALFLTACDDRPENSSPVFDDPELTQGKTIWMQVCRNCHLKGVAGAPAIGDAQAWRQRLTKGKTILYQNAINGIPKEQGWSMPPRGGLDNLSDAEVRLAVDYMLTAQKKFAEKKL
jgi:cytochrome c5